MSGILYIVPTPIGNLGDITARAAETLSAVDFIAAEDTRVTVRLLNHLGIKKQLVSYYEHNAVESGEKILSRLIAGESCAIVSDAGTPAVSDPGEALVKSCAEMGIEVISLPGPCAAIAALAVSGLSTQRFTFEGFLSVKRKSRFDHLKSLRAETRTMIFYEAPHKLLTTLGDMLSELGDRRISISRELTKLHDETIRTTLSQALIHFNDNPPRGEFVLVVEGAAGSDIVNEKTASPAEAAERVDELRSGGMKLMEAVRLVSEETGISKNELYSVCVSTRE